MEQERILNTLYENIQEDIQGNIISNREYEILQQKCRKIREEFEINLTEEQKLKLEQLIVVRCERDAIETKKCFMEGFKLAIRILTEALLL